MWIQEVCQALLTRVAATLFVLVTCASQACAQVELEHLPEGGVQVTVPAGAVFRYDYISYRQDYANMDPYDNQGTVHVTMAVEANGAGPARFVIRHSLLDKAIVSNKLRPPRIDTHIEAISGFYYFDFGSRDEFRAGRLATSGEVVLDDFREIIDELEEDASFVPGDKTLTATREFGEKAWRSGFVSHIIVNPEQLMNDINDDSKDKTDAVMRAVFWYPAFAMRTIRGGAPGSELVLIAKPEADEDPKAIFEAEIILIDGGPSLAANYQATPLGVNHPDRNLKKIVVSNFEKVNANPDRWKADIDNNKQLRVADYSIVQRARMLAEKVGHLPTSDWQR